jgi:uncharacterized membrane protein
MTRKLFVFEILLIGVALAATAAIFPYISERIPINWDLHGRVNGYGSRSALFLIGPGIMSTIMLLTALLPWLSPKGVFAIASFASTYRQIMRNLFLLFAYIHAILLWAASGHKISFDQATMCGLCIFVILLGNVMGKLRQNAYIGIVTADTLADERVWYATHRFAAMSTILGGLLGLTFSLAGLHGWPLLPILIGVTIPAFYAFLYTKRLERRGEL